MAEEKKITYESAMEHKIDDGSASRMGRSELGTDLSSGLKSHRDERKKTMCGHCVHFFTSSNNSGADDGYCNAILDEDEVGKEVSIYTDASKCPKFEELGRIRTNIREFSWDQTVRVQREFDEE